MIAPRRILVSAFVGSENLGDEAIFLAFVDQLSTRLEASRLTVASIDPERTKHLLRNLGHDRVGNIRVVRRRMLPLAILQHGICIFGGGGIVQDQSSILNLLYFLLQILFARLVRRSVVPAFVGIGPLESRFGRVLTRVSLSNLPLCVVRDQQSKQLLQDIGITGTEIVCASDIALDLSCKAPVSETGSAFGKYVVLSLRHWYRQSERFTPAAFKTRITPGTRFDTFLTCLASELTTFLEGNAEYCVVAVPFFGDRDTLVHAGLRDRLAPRHRPRLLLHDSLSDPCQYIALARSARCVVGMRLHSLILATINPVPLVALSYSSKVASFMQQIGMDEQTINVELEPENVIGLAERLAEALKNSDELRRAIGLRTTALKKANELALARLIQVISADDLSSSRSESRKR